MVYILILSATSYDIKNREWRISNTFCFIQSQIEKSRGVKSGERGGREIDSPSTSDHFTESGYEPIILLMMIMCFLEQ